MIPAAFDYHAAASVADAVRLLGELGPDAKLLAGGHSLLPAMKFRMATPALLVDINKIAGLAYIKEEDGWWAVLLVKRRYRILLWLQ